jgi:hypothetical protein
VVTLGTRIVDEKRNWKIVCRCGNGGQIVAIAQVAGNCARLNAPGRRELPALSLQLDGIAGQYCKVKARSSQLTGKLATDTGSAPCNERPVAALWLYRENLCPQILGSVVFVGV